MKKFCLYLIIAVLSISFTFGVSASDGITVLLDGKPLEFDVPPVIVNDRTMVPMRKIFESLGATITWDNISRRVEAIFEDGTHILLTIDSVDAYKNDARVKLDAAPFIKDGRTMVPVRFIGESSGANVGWISDTKTVKITPAWNTVRFVPFGEYLSIPSPVSVSQDFKVLSYLRQSQEAVAVFDITNITDEEIVKYRNYLVTVGYTADVNDLSAETVVLKSGSRKLTTTSDRSEKTFTVIIGQ